jgi:iron(III) transport system ATP-binding protein
MTVANRIVVMHNGAILQVGNAVEIYDQPADRTVASFVGALNRIPARVMAPGGPEMELSCPFGVAKVRNGHTVAAVGDGVDLCVRPELAMLRESAGENTWPARIEQVAFLGQYTAYVVSLGEVQVHIHDNQRRDLLAGQTAYLHLPPDRCFVFPSDGGRAESL